MAPLVLAGCESLPDIPSAINPLTWFEDDEPVSSQAAGAGTKKDFPKLSSVPPRPPVPSLEAQQAKIKQGLVADQKNARYTDTQIRREADRRTGVGPRASGNVAAPAPRLPQSVPPSGRPGIPPPPTLRGASAARAIPPPRVARPAVPPPPTVRQAARPVPAPPPVRRPLEARVAARPAAPPVTALQPVTPQIRQTARPSRRLEQPGQPVKIGTIYFADNSKTLQREDVAILRQVAEAQRSTGRTIRIVGHASGRAKTFDQARRARINYQVSLDRANSIAAALAGMGVPTGRIQVEGAGDTAPIYAEYTATGEAANRRAELYMLN